MAKRTAAACALSSVMGCFTLFADAPAPDRPRMIIRFSSGEEKPDIWKRMFEQLKKYRAACDEVWFSTGVSIVPLEKHQEQSKLMAEAAKDLRAVGIIPSLQIQSTIGHGDNPNADNRALTWGTYVGKNGEVCRTNNCPRQKEFHRYLYEMAKIYAQWHPGSVWIDDDLRLDNHSPAMEYGGCYCRDCLAEFSRQEKHEYTREELLSACKKDAKLNQRWLDFGARSLELVAEAIADGFREVSPETRLGLQHCQSPERVNIYQALHQKSGRRVASRPGAGTYSDRDPFNILLKGTKISYEIYTQPGYELLDQVVPEIEDYPRVYSSKTARGHQLEALFYLAMGGDSLSYDSITPNLETPECYGEHILKSLAQEAAVYRQIADHHIGSLPGGVGTGQVYLYQYDFGLSLIGIPFASHSPAACATMLTAEMIDNLSDSQLKETLKKDLILDGAAAAAIAQRGFGDAIGGIESRLVKDAGIEVYTPTSSPFSFIGNLAGNVYSLPTTLKYAFGCPESDKIQILSCYGNDPRLPATVLLSRPDGTRVALIGQEGFQTICVSTSRVEFLTRIADWVSHGKLPVVAAEPVRCLFAPRVTANGALRSITVINTTIGHHPEFKLNLRGVPAGTRQAEWLIPGKATQVLPLQANGEFTSVTIPELEGWEGGWLKI